MVLLEDVTTVIAYPLGYPTSIELHERAPAIFQDERYEE
jgi:hypothetical protein